MRHVDELADKPHGRGRGVQRSWSPAAVQVMVRPGVVRWVLVGGVVALLAGDLFAAWLSSLPEDLFGGEALIHLLAMNDEGNLPTLFSALLLAFAGLVARLVAGRAYGDPSIARRWRVLAIVLAVLALDEAVMLHEWLSAPIRRAFDLGGPLYWAWVVPYGLLAIAVAAYLWKALMSLRPARRAWVLLGGALYVLGAVVIEMLGSDVYASVGNGSLRYWLLTTLEETLEMSGVVVFIWALLPLAAGGSATLRIGGRPHDRPGSSAPVS